MAAFQGVKLKKAKNKNAKFKVVYGNHTYKKTTTKNNKTYVKQKKRKYKYITLASTKLTYRS